MRLIVFCGLALLVLAAACGGKPGDGRIQKTADELFAQMTADPLFDCQDVADAWFGYAPIPTPDPLEDVPQEDWDDIGRLVQQRLDDYCAEDTQE